MNQIQIQIHLQSERRRKASGRFHKTGQCKLAVVTETKARMNQWICWQFIDWHIWCMSARGHPYLKGGDRRAQKAPPPVRVFVWVFLVAFEEGAVLILSIWFSKSPPEERVQDPVETKSTQRLRESWDWECIMMLSPGQHSSQVKQLFPFRCCMLLPPSAAVQRRLS